MDFNFESHTIFDQADSFSAFTEQVRPSRPDAQLGDCGQQCELKQYDSVFNSKGDRVVLQSGTRYNLDKDKGVKSHASALAETKIWQREGPEYTSELEIRSPYMKAAIKAIVPEYRDFDIDLRHITLQHEPYCIFHYRHELFFYGQALMHGSEDQKHVSFLIEYMQQALSRPIYTWSIFVESAALAGSPPSLNFTNLWMAYKPGDLVVLSETTSTTKKLRIAEFKSMRLSCRCDSYLCMRRHYWQVLGYKIDCVSSELGYRTFSTEIEFYEGYQPLSELLVTPLHFYRDENDIRTQLLRRGQKFVGLQGHHHRFYKGTAEVLVKDRDVVDTYGDDDRSPIQSRWVNGRVIIDHDAFFEARPAHDIWLLDKTKERFKLEGGKPPQLTESQYLICHHEVPGYSLNEKKWAFFNVDLLEEISFNDQAFQDSLIMDEKYKKILLTLVRVHSNPSFEFDDIIKGKGQGVIILLHGEPGVGKTLTAESVADECRRPLLRIDASTLGSTAETVEDGLTQVFQLAKKWNAVVLLDEADVFMEKRTATDIARNSLIAVFLRVLEYYEGILFLTTNRVECFDPAFMSRIHLTIQYPKLGYEGRKALWNTFISKTSLNSGAMVAEGLIDDLASQDLNGRQIKNAVRIALAMASQEGEMLGKQHFDVVLDAMKFFNEGPQADVLPVEAPLQDGRPGKRQRTLL